MIMNMIAVDKNNNKLNTEHFNYGLQLQPFIVTPNWWFKVILPSKQR